MNSKIPNNQPQEIPEVIPFVGSKEWIETNNELYTMMEDFMKRMNQQKALLAAQREQELHEQEHATQEKEELPQNSDFRQLIEEVCDLIESALNSKLLLINLNSQRLDKEKQELKNVVEQAPKRRTRFTECLKNFKVIHKKSIIPLNKTPQISSVNAITPDLPTVEPDNSLSMGDKHLNTIPEMESDKLIKSSVENLFLIPSEFKGISNDTCDVPVCEDSSIFDALKDHYEILSDYNDDGTSSDDDAYKDIKYVEASLPDSELVSLEEVNDVGQEKEEIDLEDILQIQDVILWEKLLNINRLITNIESLNDNPTPDCVLKSPSLFPIPVVDNDSFFEEFDTSPSYLINSLPKFETFSDHTKETSSGSTTTHANNSLPEYDSFHFEIEPDQGELTNVVMETILGEPRVHMLNILPTQPTLDSNFIPSDDSFRFGLEVSFGTRNKIFDPRIFFEVQSKRFLSRDTFSPTYISLPFEDHHYLSFTYVIQTFLPYFTYPVNSPLLLSARSEHTIFDPSIST
ncbi:hypothetical protein Tco_0737158 [Tanacetum coccineum]